MRYLLATLVLTVVTIRAAENGEIPPVNESSVPSESQQQKNQELIAQNPALISSGKIVGTEADGKSAFVSVPHYEITGQNAAKKDFHIVRASDVTAQGLVPVNDGGNTVDDTTVPPLTPSLGSRHSLPGPRFIQKRSNGNRLDPTLERAIEILQKEDSNQGYAEAYKHYQNDLGYFMMAHKNEGNDRLRRLIGTKIAGHEVTIENMKVKMDKIQEASVKVKGPHAQTVVEAASKDTTKPPAEVKAKTDEDKKPAENAKKAAEKAVKKAASGGGGDKPADSGGAVCKRDGRFCLIGNRSTKATAIGKDTASTIAKKTADKSMSRKAVTAAAASRKANTASKPRLASSGSKTGASKSAARTKGATNQRALSTKQSSTTKSSTKNSAVRKQTSKMPAGTKKTNAKLGSSDKKGATTRKATTGKALGTKKSGTSNSASKSSAVRNQASKQPAGTKKLAGKSTSSSKKDATTKKTTTGKISNTKKTGATKKAGANSMKAPTKKSGTAKVASPNKMPIANKKSTTGQKLTPAKPAANKKPASAGPSKQQTKSSSKATVRPAAVKAAAAKPTKKNNRRDLTWNRPQMVYEAVQTRKGLMEESALDQLD